MEKTTRLQWFDNHIYTDTPGLQAPNPTEKPLCGIDIPKKTTMRGHIEAGDVYHEPGCCADCKRAVSKALKGK